MNTLALHKEMMSTQTEALGKIQPQVVDNNTFKETVVLSGLPRFCPKKAVAIWGTVILVCSVAIAISVSAQIDFIYSAFWVSFSALATLFIVIATEPSAQSIKIQPDSVSIYCAGKMRSQTPIEKVDVEQVCWLDAKGQAHPALILKGKKVGTFSIGYAKEDDNWISYWKSIKNPQILITKAPTWSKVLTLLQCE